MSYQHNYHDTWNIFSYISFYQRSLERVSTNLINTSIKKVLLTLKNTYSHKNYSTTPY